LLKEGEWIKLFKTHSNITKPCSSREMILPYLLYLGDGHLANASPHHTHTHTHTHSFLTKEKEEKRLKNTYEGHILGVQAY
jgi:hypothetical protein